MTAEIALRGKRGEGKVMLVDEDWAPFFRERSVIIGTHGYPTFRLEGEMVLAHRHVMGCTKGDGTNVDHANRNRLDNRRSNLRVCTDWRINSLNRPPGRGVYRQNGKWFAQLGLGGRSYYLGTFDSEAAALAAVAAFRAENVPRHLEGA